MEFDQKPISEEKNQPFYIYIFYAIGIIIYSFNMKHGEGHFRFSGSPYFESLKYESISTTLILIFLTIIMKFQIISLEISFHPIFLIVWILLSLSFFLKIKKNFQFILKKSELESNQIFCFERC